ncbi:MAG: response regulator [Synechococcales cyanobacterium CRU_2_2]|nr:response regulator [Synechococcales cyanobacterium CRU_2_2]
MDTRRILIVDDEPYICEVARLCLEAATDWTVLTAESGMACLEMVGQQQPDVILMDVMMPGLDGLSTIQQLQANPKTQAIPVILLTAGGTEGDRPTLYGVKATIAKPFDPLALSAQIVTILGWPREN